MLDVGCSVLSALRANDRERLLSRSVPRSLRRGEALFFSGEASGRIHILKYGVLKLAVADSEGNETLIGLALPGELVGEVSAIDDEGQSFDAIAATTCDVVGLDARALLQSIYTTPKAAEEMARVMARRNRLMCTTAFERTSSPVTARLAGQLLDLAENLGRTDGRTIELELPLAQHDLGRLAGMCRESACKTMQRFKRGGVVDYRGRKLRILRPDVLEKIRCAGRGAKPSR